ncbi:hypothetical protein Syn7502_01125 [Synechococcus sp. PCC 7502]|uniref:DODA-type extradiol aromatic ring-opening family dioxygenase n=1 Tax=Synechococcus sp. PCC 7502 TaxID=1173263 RepID=UPI00029FA60A|nr:class III extradiol ring-cleavage dioxygenase [Synechococcus sp. PCC 7502]AFY73234.1 hypothetical protein Syn7502_01125 [Synechococcus sp. PCC 7502]
MLPAIFISHGSPDMAILPSPARSFLMQLGQKISKPKAILIISAHWNTRIPQVNATLQPQTLHDFGGFPSELYKLNYPASIAPEVTNRVKNLLDQNGFFTEIVSDRGLDHGVWSPLMLIYPNADIPITQLSVQPEKDAAYHFHLGQALAPLVAEGVLIIGSGSATHNLMEIGRYVSPPAWVREFTDWLSDKIINFDLDALFNYKLLAPHAKRNHPTPEHLLPLFVVMGASGKDAQATQIHDSYTHGILSMAAFRFESVLS